MENNTTNGSPAQTPPSRFMILDLADLDEMTEFRETARWMEENQCVDNLAPSDASRLAKAIVDKYGPRTVRIETHTGGKRVIRCAPRPLIERKRATQKAPGTPRKRAAKKTEAPAVANG